jgi:hypothetical protein
MRLSPAGPESSTANAYVIFTSADACDKYYDRYPNGFDVRFQGKKYAVLVNKGEDVDVISGMMQGYIDCGATRVIKVSQVDEEWGIVALNKLAEGKNKVRQVETVLDAYRNGVNHSFWVFRTAGLTLAGTYYSFPLRQHL